MKKISHLIHVILFSATVVGCASTPAPDAQAKAETESAPSPVRPAADKFRAHAQDHISYPASREDVLASCADTTEFSDAEKQWVAEKLPAGEYGSAERVLEAVGI